MILEVDPELRGIAEEPVALATVLKFLTPIRGRGTLILLGEELNKGIPYPYI
jgi:hypothetical protein